MAVLFTPGSMEPQPGDNMVFNTECNWKAGLLLKVHLRISFLLLVKTNFGFQKLTKSVWQDKKGKMYVYYA